MVGGVFWNNLCEQMSCDETTPEEVWLSNYLLLIRTYLTTAPENRKKKSNQLIDQPYPPLADTPRFSAGIT